VRLLPRRRPKIEKLRQAGDVDGLRAMLDYRDTQVASDGVLWDMGAPVRADAATALATFDGPVVEEGLTRALSDSHPAVRKAALDAIAGLPRPAAVDRLLHGVVMWPFPSDYSALEQVIGILVDWAPEGLAEDLVDRLLQPDAPPLDERHEDAFAALLSADPRGEAANTRVAEKLVGELAQPASGARAERAEEMMRWLGATGAEGVLRTLEGERASVPLVRAAAALRDARAVEPLVTLLGTGDADVRAAAASALGRLNDTRAAQALLTATQDPEQDVRDSASEALNGMGMAAVIVVVAGVMRDAVREQLARGEGEAEPAQELPAAAPGSNAPPAAPPPHPPTRTQEMLTRLLKRAGGQS
jgi:HEAT repeat protein